MNMNAKDIEKFLIEKYGEDRFYLIQSLSKELSYKIQTDDRLKEYLGRWLYEDDIFPIVLQIIFENYNDLSIESHRYFMRFSL